MADAIWAFGTHLYLSDGDANNPTYHRVTFVNEINPPGGTTSEIETTNHDTEDGFTTFIAGLKTADNVEMNINYDPGNSMHRLLYQKWLDGTLEEWRLVVVDNSVPIQAFDFTGFVMSFSIATPINDRMTAAVSIKPSGKPQTE